MLDNFNNSNITVFATIFLQGFCLLPFYCTTRSWASYKGLTENAGHENDGPSKLQGMKLQDMNTTDQK